MPRFLGQHFLIRESIVHKILRSLDFNSDKNVLEIGPGKGALTLPLTHKAEKLLLVEKDPGFAERLQEKWCASEHIRCVHSDFLHFPLEEIKKNLGDRFKIISNLPYETATAILVRCLKEFHPYVDEMALMFQKEVADRILAKPSTKDFGSLTVFTQLFANVKRVTDVSPEAFSPPPKVWSTVLHFRILEKPRIDLSALSHFESLVHSGFIHRRKMLRQNLKTFFMGATSEAIENKLISIGAKAEARAEELSADQWLRLFSLSS